MGALNPKPLCNLIQGHVENIYVYIYIYGPQSEDPTISGATKVLSSRITANLYRHIQSQYLFHVRFSWPSDSPLPI